MQYNNKNIDPFEETISRITYQVITVPFNKSKEEAWQVFDAQVFKGKFVFTSNWIKYAAVFVIGALGISFYLSGNTSYQTHVDESVSITLPDNSIVDLKPSSSLEFNRWHYLISRDLKLKGDAMFSVRKGSDFSVKGEFGKVSVFGTVFEINSTSKFEVVCHTGRVQITTINSDKVLTGGQAFSNREVSINKEDALSFQRASAKLILNFIKEFYKVEISYSSELNQKYTGSIPLTDINEALKALCLPLGLDYTQEEPGKYRLIND